MSHHRRSISCPTPWIATEDLHALSGQSLVWFETRAREGGSLALWLLRQLQRSGGGAVEN